MPAPRFQLRLWLLPALLCCMGAGAQDAAIPVAAPPEIQTESPRTSGIDDSAIARHIVERFQNDVVLADQQLHVVVQDGRVTLTGGVPHLPALDRATSISQSVRGVVSVDNQIAIAGITAQRTPEEDSTLRQEVIQALQEDAGTAAYKNLDIGVQNGSVSMAGSVDSSKTAELLREVVSSVAGVRALHTDLKMGEPGQDGTGATVGETPSPHTTGTAQSTDQALLQEVRTRLQWNALVQAEGIDVEVENGVVRLSGQVSSAAEQQSAIHDAHIPGVTEVDATALQVGPWLRGEHPRVATQQPRDDAETARAVRAVLAGNPRVSSGEVQVEVLDGVVTLSGATSHLSGARQATQAARSVRGVLNVVDHIRVQPTDVALEAGVLAAMVRNALRRDTYLTTDTMDATEAQGAVTLSGTVKNAFLKARAEEVASRVAGVTQVNNELVLEDPDRVVVYDPYVDRWDWRDYAWWSRVERKSSGYTSDEALAEAVRDQFHWSPYMDDTNLEISVSKGVVTLSGSVHAPEESEAAARAALHAGAISVVNSIAIGQ